MSTFQQIKTSLPPLVIRGRSLLPVVQGGMGVGISAHRLAGSVAAEGAVGTIASVELRQLHPDLVEKTRRTKDTRLINEANLEALDREIRAARDISGNNGLIAVNVMKAVGIHGDLVRQACESGADAIVMGAGLPMDLPDVTAEYPDIALIPILSEERGVRAVLKRWMRKNRLPDAIVIETPHAAGGHLGASNVDEINNPKFSLKRVLEEVSRVLDELGISRESIPLIPAGGINSFSRLKEVISYGARAGQIGTPFAVTEECDAHIRFKEVLANAKPSDIVTFLSTAGLPARAVLTPWLKKYLSRESLLQARASVEKATCAIYAHCLSHCGLKDGNAQAGQFCIDNKLGAALRGEVDKGLFFRGSEALPFGNEIHSVRDLLTYLLTGVDPRVSTPGV